MSKERLEEIRTRLKYGLGCLKHLRREILNSDDESLKDQINLLENDIKYLFEQAERVQELEVWYHSYHKEAKLNNILKIQNKRYREQLELIRKDTFYEDHEFVSVRHLIRKRVDKALKGGNEW